MGFGVITSLPRAERGYVAYEHLERLAWQMEQMRESRDQLIAAQRKQLEAWIKFATEAVGYYGQKRLAEIKAQLLRDTRKVLG